MLIYSFLSTRSSSSLLSARPPLPSADIRRAITPHCFRLFVLRSSPYLLRDLSAVTALLYVVLVAFPSLPAGPTGGALRLATWPLNWAAQGCVLNSACVVALECGHHTFSEHAALDDAVGFALHMALL
ncbi:delta(12)-acyl-lipid-desaturase-like [Miscanthus floridulus]|uniref:delta(12)-acyl-lipid-desaturase-like n=1 Tax=Miscanthus floridulus TaxID=154761 RepID=UPI0034585393